MLRSGVNVLANTISQWAVLGNVELYRTPMYWDGSIFYCIIVLA